MFKDRKCDQKVTIERRHKFVPAIIKENNMQIILQPINRNVRVRLYRTELFQTSGITKIKTEFFGISKSQIYGGETSEVCIVTESRTDQSGRTPKRYTTTCHIKPATVPIWYTESLYLKIGSTKRKYEEKIYFKNKLLPYRWSETMNTEVKTAPKNIVSEIYIPVEKSDIHYISLMPQQIAASAN